MRPELFPAKLSEFIECELGAHFAREQLVPLSSSLEETSAEHPLLFVLSPGDDPSEELKKLAQEQGRFLTFVSLGKGQGQYAAEQVRAALESGQWVFLQNCHLATSWLPSLEELATSEVALRLHQANNNINGVKASSDFRLILSSMSLPQFPMTLLQDAVKVTKDPPSGLKNNVVAALPDLQNASAAMLGSLLSVQSSSS